MSDTDIVPYCKPALTSLATQPDAPTIVFNAGPNARYAYAEFFGDELGNDHTRKAYRFAVHRFLDWCESHGFTLERIPPGVVGEYIRSLRTTGGKQASKPTQKIHLAAIRAFGNSLVQRHAIVLNPAASVRGPRLKVTTGKTPATDPAQARRLLQSIDTSHVVGLRDRAILATLMYTACRVGAVAKLHRRDFYTDGQQFYLRFDEKGGNERQIPCRHDLQAYIQEYIDACGPTDDDDLPLFRSAVGRTNQLTARSSQAKDIHRIVKRRLKDAGLPTLLTCHSFRATTATDLLEQGVPIDDEQSYYLLLARYTVCRAFDWLRGFFGKTDLPFVAAWPQFFSIARSRFRLS